MPRRPRICPAGCCFHVLNRAVARLPLFEKPEDYEAFERVLGEAFEREPLPILAYTVMPSHWHFVVRPRGQRQLSDFFRWLDPYTHHALARSSSYGRDGAPLSGTLQGFSDRRGRPSADRVAIRRAESCAGVAVLDRRGVEVRQCLASCPWGS